VRFWDSSAVVALLIGERATEAVQRVYADDPLVAAWWATEVECVSALARRERAREIEPDALAAALARLDELRLLWHEVDPGSRLRQTARRLLRSHDLRAADALQLAAAITASEGRPESLGLVTLDDRLALAAEREGFPIVSG
jgi:predicted nucleic acid-binding protein